MDVRRDHRRRGHPREAVGLAGKNPVEAAAHEIAIRDSAAGLKLHHTLGHYLAPARDGESRIGGLSMARDLVASRIFGLFQAIIIESYCPFLTAGTVSVRAPATHQA